MDYQSKNVALPLLSRYGMTTADFFGGCIKVMVGSISDNVQTTFQDFHCILYAKIMKIYHNQGWAYLACRRCNKIAKESYVEGSKMWCCKMHGRINAHDVVIRYRIFVCVEDDIGSACFLLFNDDVFKLASIEASTLIRMHGEDYNDSFPLILDRIVGKEVLFRFQYNHMCVSNNNPIYRVNKISEDKAFIYFFHNRFYAQISPQYDEVNTKFGGDASSFENVKNTIIEQDNCGVDDAQAKK